MIHVAPDSRERITSWVRQSRHPAGPVLILEDNDHIRERLVRRFEEDGFDTVTAADGDQALRQLHGGLRPCVIVLNLMIPVTDGTFRREQFADPELGNIPVVIYSAQHKARTQVAAADPTSAIGDEGLRSLESLSRIVQANCLTTRADPSFHQRF